VKYKIRLPPKKDNVSEKRFRCFSVETPFLPKPYRRPQDLEKWKAALAQAGLPALV
jgi:hypothetical protein